MVKIAKTAPHFLDVFRADLLSLVRRAILVRTAALIVGPFFILGLGSCFPVGLPEYFSEPQSVMPAFQTTRGAFPSKMAAVESAASLDRRVLVLFPMAELESDFAEPERLGHQYLLGFIPFTRVYFQHGPQRFLLEILLDELSRDGYAVFAADEKQEVAARKAINPQMVLRAHLVNPSLSGLDALFFRVLRVSGELVVEQFETGNNPDGHPQAVSRVSLDHSKFRKFAYGPTLRNEFEAALREAIKKVTAGFSPFKRRALAGGMISRDASLDEWSPEPFIVSFPQSLNEIRPEVRKLLAGSYGYSSLPAYTEPAVGRMIQHGFHHAASLAGYSAVITTSPIANSKLAHVSGQGFWNLRANIRSIDVNGANDGRMSVGVAFSLFEVRENGELLLDQKDCHLAALRPPPVDGAWVAGLEQAAGSLLNGFMGVPAEGDDVTCFAPGVGQ